MWGRSSQDTRGHYVLPRHQRHCEILTSCQLSPLINLFRSSSFPSSIVSHCIRKGGQRRHKTRNITFSLTWLWRVCVCVCARACVCDSPLASQLPQWWLSPLMWETVRWSCPWSPTSLWMTDSGTTWGQSATWRRPPCRSTSFPSASWRLRLTDTPVYGSAASCLWVRVPSVYTATRDGNYLNPESVIFLRRRRRGGGVVQQAVSATFTYR